MTFPVAMFFIGCFAATIAHAVVAWARRRRGLPLRQCRAILSDGHRCELQMLSELPHSGPHEVWIDQLQQTFAWRAEEDSETDVVWFRK